ncbi:MAG: tetratricopeptide repeat protein [Oscillospiraceae bacterium]|jgi:tetratricopeptide (TPR) repeat protein|nr:tetratricopeptide repeat protein [Oscillospiraceae bacterium]
MKQTKPMSISFNRFLDDVFCKTDNETRFCFILGSGASKACGIPTGSELEREWSEYIKKNFSDEDKAVVMRQMGIMESDLDPKKSENYFNLYYMRYSSRPNAGIEYLEKIMQKAQPSCGFYTLAKLMTSSKHNLVLTTNFDSMVEQGISIYTGVSAQIINHESLAGYFDLRREHPTIIKLHRSLFFDPQNLPSEMMHLNANWKKLLHKVFTLYTPIVIGYGGGDNTLMEYLCDTNNNIHDLYWFKLKGDKYPLSTRVADMLLKRNGRVIEIDNERAFDNIMWEIGNRQKYNDAVDWLRDSAEERVKQYNEQISEFEKSAKTPKLKFELKNRWEKQISDATGQINQNPLNWIAYINRANAYDELKNYNYAISDYNKAIELKPNQALMYLLRAAIYCKLKKWDEALVDCNKGIELESDRAKAYILRSIIYDVLGRHDEAEADRQKAAELDSE